ncbi:MAG: hypothetical protein IJ764_04065 [Bacteroidales bacterium]|nr:hypothetical protein [Bacteroidales bacterium]
MAYYRKRAIVINRGEEKEKQKWMPAVASVSSVSTRKLASDIEKESTVSIADIMAVLYALPGVVRRYLAEGHTVKLDGMGTFRLSIQCQGTLVDSEEAVTPDQITNIKVQFVPEMQTPATGRKGKRVNTLIASDMEWHELPPKAKKASAETDGTSSTPSGSTGGSTGSGSGSGNGGGNNDNGFS